MDSLAGRTLTHYLDKLSEGGMGVVCKARDTRLKRLVAIKILPPHKPADAARRARSIQEAQTAAFIVMELVPERTLDDAK